MSKNEAAVKIVFFVCVAYVLTRRSHVKWYWKPDHDDNSSAGV